MTKYLKTKKSILSKTVVAVSALLMVGCGAIDNTLGDGFISKTELMDVAVYKDFKVTTYILKGDTIVTNILDANNKTNCSYFWGSRNEIGYTNTEFAAQFMGGTYAADTTFGDEPTAQMFEFALGIGDYNGNPAEKLELEVYLLKKKIIADSIYKSDVKLETSDIGELLFKMDVKDGKFQKKIVTRLFDIKGEYPEENNNMSTTPAFTEFMNKLMKTNSGDTIFYSAFPGLYFKLVNPNSNGAVYTIDPGNTYFGLKYRNKGMESKPDSTDLYAHFYFDNSVRTWNTGFTMISFNYDQTAFANQIGDTTTLINGGKLCYVQGLGGLKSYIKLDADQIKAFRDKVKADGYKDISINNAKIVFQIETPTTQYLRGALARLGMYSVFRLNSTEEATNGLTGIIDYNIEAEANGQTIAYGGGLNRTFGTYEMDITRYVNRMMSSTYDGDFSIILAPSDNVFRDILTSDEVALGGSDNDNPNLRPQLVITYTMIGKTN